MRPRQAHSILPLFFTRPVSAQRERTLPKASRSWPRRRLSLPLPARLYLLRFLRAGREAEADALCQRGKAGGRAGETLLAQLPHGIPRWCLAGSKVGGAQPRPEKGRPRHQDGPPSSSSSAARSPAAVSAGRRTPLPAPPPS